MMPGVPTPQRKKSFPLHLIPQSPFMWHKIGEMVIRHRLALLAGLFVTTCIMAYFAAQVKMSYEFSRAIPTDHPRYQEYLAFKQRFGEDGNLLTIGFISDSTFTPGIFGPLEALQDSLRRIRGVEDILSAASAANLVRNDSTGRLETRPIFVKGALGRPALDSGRMVFESLPFYRGLLYNPHSHAYLVGVRLDSRILSTQTRDTVVGLVEARAAEFEEATGLELRYSGLPHIRFNMMTRIGAEMKRFLLASVLLSALILFLFFRSVSTMLLSLSVVVIGVVWSLGTLVLMGYRISLLTALIPPLVVVIGIPNCIYFLNKYHTSYIDQTDKRRALVEMVSKMGIVTLFCNVSAAIGFAVFALTRSVILQEFGVVAGINIMALFIISLILLPSALSYLPAPKERHTRYLESLWLSGLLRRVERWVFSHSRAVHLGTWIVLVFSITGMLRLRSEGYVVDDLPKDDKVYTDLKFFEQHFKGIMPLEMVVDAGKKNGFTGMRALDAFAGIDSLAQYLSGRPETAKPLSLAEGLKFARQAFYGGDSTSYAMPNAFDGAFLGDYLRPPRVRADSSAGLGRILSSFMDSGRQVTRITVNMADIGSRRLPLLLDTLRQKANQYIDTSRFEVTFTGTCVTFLEGSRYIINGLRDSIGWAFLLISLCMLYLFRSFRILLCSLIPNLIPLMLTAGVMGWTGIALKPSTVLVFSVTLGIAIDVTIRFLVNYKQELPHHEGDIRRTILHTIRQTGISIIYTSLVLIAGFIIFVFSGFGGTQALGWLTSLTLLTATVTNLVLLPVLLMAFSRRD